MSQTDLVLLNQSFVPRQEALVDIEDRGYQFGDGVYEVIRVYDGHVFLMDEHLQRLERSANEVALSLPTSLKSLEEDLIQLVKKTGCTDGIIYLQVTRGVASRNHGFPGDTVPAQLVAYTKPMNRPLTEQEQGVKTVLIDDIRWLRCDIKTINLLPNVLAKQEAVKRGAFETIQHRDGLVTEGSSSNLFIIKEETVFTHPANNLILNGITRQFVLQLCADLNLSVSEQTFHVNDLYQADEAFITSTTSEIIPVIKVDDKQIGEGKPGSLTRRLQSVFTEHIEKLSTQNNTA